MEKPVLMNSFDEYITWVTQQSNKYGRECLKPRSYSDPKLYQFIVGIESPEGWHGVHIRRLKRLADSPEETIKIFKTRLLQAIRGVHESIQDQI